MHPIEHVVVLMLENRSFDCLLGKLYPKSEQFDGLEGGESNPWHKPDGTVEQIRVWNSEVMTAEAACLPDPEPGELFEDVNVQLFGLEGDPDGQPDMSGFVDNYARQPWPWTPEDPSGIMHYFLPSQVPIISRLALDFGVSDRWYASTPSETWPNRYFAHCGTAGGHVNNSMNRFPYQWPRLMPTIFRRLGRHGYSWKIYFHDIPQAVSLFDLWPRIPTHFCRFEREFERHCRTGRLPNYSFIEPRYFPTLLSDKMPNDQHPPHNLLYGEQLIATVYNAVRNSPLWPRTLLLIVYDEHGGSFDHAVPPEAVPPGEPYPDGFRFDRYGIRVPAVIVSPYVAPGSVIRPPLRSDGTESYPFDHTSIIATLHKLFDIGPAMTPRVAAAPDLLPALTLERPENDGPDRLTIDPRRPHLSQVWKLRRRRRNRNQRNLRNPLLFVPRGVAELTGAVRGVGARVVPEAWRRKRPNRIVR
ncbi:MAG: alkaline phosphatase family protein [Alphaproteobacteria bacterium]